MSNPDPRRTGKSLTDIHDELLAMSALQPLRTLCAHCAWTHEGTALEGQQAFARHLAGEHPNVTVRRRHVPGYAMHLAVRKRRDQARATANGETA